MPAPNKMFTLISVLAFLVFAVSATEAYSQVEATGVIPTTESCGTPAVGCEVCGASYEGCGTSACFNPSAGEICCNSIFVCPASHTCGDAEGTCNPPTVTTTLETTLRTTSTMTTTATIALDPVNGPNYGPGPAQTPPPHSTPITDVNSTLPNIPDSSSAAPIVTPTLAPTEPEPFPTNPPANESQPAIIETPAVPANTTSTTIASSVIDASTSSSGDSVTTSTSFVTSSTSYTTRTESQASDTAGASANPTSGAASEGGTATWWGSVVVASMLGAWIVQCLT